MVTVRPAIWRNLSMNKSRPRSGGHRGIGRAKATKASRDNRSRQLNPEHSAYRRSRGMQESPTGSCNGTRAMPPKR